MKKRTVLKPQDVLVLFSLLLAKESKWVVAEIANRASLSVSETHAAIERLEACRLFDPLSRHIIIDAAEELLIHGVKYIFPTVSNGGIARGMPTAHSAPPLSEEIVSEPSEPVVWPCAYGQSRGSSVPPLYKSAPDAAQKDRNMYEFLALTDALRMGRAREEKVAADLLSKKLHSVNFK